MRGDYRGVVRDIASDRVRAHRADVPRDPTAPEHRHVGRSPLRTCHTSRGPSSHRSVRRPLERQVDHVSRIVASPSHLAFEAVTAGAFDLDRDVRVLDVATHRTSPRWSTRRCASMARSDAADTPYRASIVGDRQPPSDCRSETWPPLSRNRCAIVCRYKCGNTPGTPAASPRDLDDLPHGLLVQRAVPAEPHPIGARGVLVPRPSAQVRGNALPVRGWNPTRRRRRPLPVTSMQPCSKSISASVIPTSSPTRIPNRRA